MYADYRPGIVPLRPLVMSDIYGGITSAIRGNPGATIGLGFLTTLLFVAPATALGGLLASRLSARLATTQAPQLGDISGTIGGYIPTLASAFAVFVMSAFMAQVVGQGVIGATTTLSQTWAATKGRLLPAIGSALVILTLSLLAAAVCLGGPVVLLVLGASGQSDGRLAAGFITLVLAMLVLVVVVLFVGTRFCFAASAIVLERLGVGGGLGRSWRLTSGTRFWRVFGIRFLTSLMASIAGAILSFPISLGLLAALRALGVSPAGMVVATVFIAALTTLITGALTTPFTAGVDTLLYIDQRIRREALDVQLVASARSRGA